MKISFAYLMDHPELVDLLATWFHREWGRRNPLLTVDSITRNLEEHLNRDSLPLTLVAFHHQEPVGSASLKIREMEIYPQYTHWLGSVYVPPLFRNQGVGTQIVRRTISEADHLGVTELYLYTNGSETFYSKFGWQSVDRPFYHGREVTVMKRQMIDG